MKCLNVSSFELLKDFNSKGVVFIGELFKLGIVSRKTVLSCQQALQGSRNTLFAMAFCKLASTAGILAEQSFDDDSCKVCFAAPNDTALAPCGHLGLCYQCAEMFVWNKCPFCKQDVDGVLRTFKQ